MLAPWVRVHTAVLCARQVCAKCGDPHGARRPATKDQSELRALEAKLEARRMRREPP